LYFFTAPPKTVHEESVLKKQNRTNQEQTEEETLIVVSDESIADNPAVDIGNESAVENMVNNNEPTHEGNVNEVNGDQHGQDWEPDWEDENEENTPPRCAANFNVKN